ncbi:MAG: methyltransferase domain-containing protein [Flavihumibacter sp.]
MQPGSLVFKKLALPRQTINLCMPSPAAITPAKGHQVYWARLWPAALAMARFIDEQPRWVDGRHCLELGAGLGLPSFAAARYAAGVIASDIAADSLPVMEETRKRGAFANVSICQMDWARVDESLEADLILLSDVNYDPSCFAPLSATLHRFLEQGKKILLASPQRLMAKSFLQPFIPHCIHQQNEEADGQAVSLFILA